MSCPLGAGGKGKPFNLAGIEIETWGKRRNILNHWVISSTLFDHFLNYFSMFFGFQKCSYNMLCSYSLIFPFSQLISDPPNFSTYPTSFSLSPFFLTPLKQTNKQTQKLNNSNKSKINKEAHKTLESFCVGQAHLSTEPALGCGCFVQYYFTGEH